MNVANGYWLPLLRMRGIPTVVNVDGIEWHRDKWSTLGKAVFKMGAKLTAMHGDFLVADSVQIERFWDDTFNRRGTFIPYGGDVVTERLDPIDGLPSGRYVLFVARLVPENTVGEFLDATEKLSRNHPVVIVGSSGSGGILEARVRRLAEAHSNVRWLGHIADDQKLYSLWQNCGVYFHGHSVGGTNPALVQAMACGAPILARDTVFNREVLLDTGMFVEPRDQAIVDAVEKLLSDRDLQVELSARAQRRAKEAYSWRSVCASYGTALALAIEQKSK
jgi:glycosyltransferase involved in cell wall biosynthesis